MAIEPHPYALGGKGRYPPNFGTSNCCNASLASLQRNVSTEYARGDGDPAHEKWDAPTARPIPAFSTDQKAALTENTTLPLAIDEPFFVDEKFGNR
jgi:hypothetical protein